MVAVQLQPLEQQIVDIIRERGQTTSPAIVNALRAQGRQATGTQVRVRLATLARFGVVTRHYQGTGQPARGNRSDNTIWTLPDEQKVA